MTNQLIGSSERAGLREWLALAVLMLPVLLVAVDNTVLGLALPAIAADLHPSATQQLWMMDAYPLVLAALLLVMGNLGDRIGRRRLLLVGATGFAAISFLTSFAPSAGWLIAGRAGMAIFGAMLMPSTLALLRSTFAVPAERRLAIAVWTATFGAGAALGPLVGGVLLTAFDWGAVFWIAVPVLVPLLALAPLLIKESRNPAPGRADLLSVALSILAMGPAVLAIKEFAVQGPGLEPLLLAGFGAAVGVIFVRRQRLLAASAGRQPMLDVALFGIPAFRYSVLVNLLSMIAMVGFLFLVSQHLQLVLQLSPLDAALVLAPGALASIVAGFGVVFAVRRIPVRVAITAALLLSASAYLSIAIAGAGVSALVLAAAFTLLGLGVGAAETLSNDLIISSAPRDRAGAASAVSETAYEVGAVLGTALLGSVVTVAYRAHLYLPAGVDGVAADAAQGSLGGALDEAARIGGERGAALADAARAAFESGVTVTTALGAALMLAAAVIAWRGLRQAR
ncbi:MFS transporter [Naumannella cuiyingiana]|uniref:DHA2 family multidrug resistance protein-like MFS transporter n=1 Tax=Naumannella cuiyingiana TaxID=1347891 RepID=A0A7Z0DAL7_9ACTN|nr:MFS transporter [Naumannella cuiyingiana]NYI71844.1 DHA2 family multidrug resistance protein-like MFS transporter [Naumannella cuiyingiana]